MKKHLPLLTLALIAAALAGTASAVLVSTSLERYAATLLDDRRFAAFASSQRSSPTSLEESLGVIQDTMVNAGVYFVDEKTSQTNGGAVLWGEDYIHGEGIVVSADGWILTTRTQLARYATDEGYAGFSVVYDGEVFLLDRVVEDTQTDAVAVRVQNAQGWTPLALAQSDEVLPGGTVFGIGALAEVNTVSVLRRGVEGESVIVPAEEPRAVWSPARPLLPGIPVLTNQARLFGFVNEEGMILPAQALRPFVRQVLRGSTVEHAALGATVVDLSLPSSLSPEVTQEYQEGALIFAPTGERSGVLTDGPADRAGLTDGDIIIAIDEIRITSTMTIADILATYAPGQQVTLRVSRNEEVKDMRVTLGTWEELVY